MGTMVRELEELGREECLRLLASVPVGRVVFTVGGLPAVEPVSHVLDGDRIVFGTREGDALLAVREGTIVAFEVDEVDVPARTGWSVTVVGPARVPAEPDTERSPVDGPRPWATDGRATAVGIEVRLVTGRRLRETITEPGETLRNT